METIVADRNYLIYPIVAYRNYLIYPIVTYRNYLMYAIYHKWLVLYVDIIPHDDNDWWD